MKDVADKELIDRAISGDKTAFDQLVIKYQHRINNLISRYISDPSEAKDVSQEAFIKAYRAMGRFRGDSAFYTWLYRIAINTAKNHLVTQAWRLVDADVDTVDVERTLTRTNLQDCVAPERVVIHDELEDMVYRAIESLPKDLRTTITLREMEGLSYDEIAGIMSCPIGTVRSRIHRARESIERRVRPWLNARDSG